MKLRVFSDLHNEFQASNEVGYRIPELPEDKETVLILAGDIDVGANAAKSYGRLHKRFIFPEGMEVEARKTKMEKSYLGELAERFAAVIYVLGNHEHYRENIDKTANKLKELIEEDSIHNVFILEDEFVVFNGVKFIGSTLWSDYNKGDYFSINACKSHMNDFKQIKMGENYKQIHPLDIIDIHNRSKEYIDQQAKGNDKVVVITHHAPSYESVHTKYLRYNDINGAYASDLTDIMNKNRNIKYWFHGHMHDGVNYAVYDTQVISNPYGYHGYEENGDFKPELVLEI